MKHPEYYEVPKKEVEWWLRTLDVMWLAEGQAKELALMTLRKSILQSIREPEPEESLPPLEYVNGDRRKKTIDVACPTCKVAAGKRCVLMTSRGKFGSPTDQAAKTFHHTRSVKARKK